MTIISTLLHFFWKKGRISKRVQHACLFSLILLRLYISLSLTNLPTLYLDSILVNEYLGSLSPLNLLSWMDTC